MNVKSLEELTRKAGPSALEEAMIKEGVPVHDARDDARTVALKVALSLEKDHRLGE